MTLTPGTRLGPYEIVAPLGAGGMGEVYKAKDTRLDRTVAIKVLPKTSASNQDLRQRFEREAKAVSSLNHPHICVLYDVGHQDGIDYLVMEYLEGETLAQRLKKGPLPTEELLQYAVQIADALDKAHHQGLVHRDLKPGNIMLTKSGSKLLDFGLAKLRATGDVVEGVTGVTRTTPLTGEGTILGTLHYMSPEQLEGQEADSRSDIFAFGCVLYEMATGRRAFDGKSQASLIASILKESPRPIAELQPSSPPILDRAIRQCLAKDSENRWQTAGDLTRALKLICEPHGVTVTTRTRPDRDKLVAVLSGVTVLALITVGILALGLQKLRSRHESTTRFVISRELNHRREWWPRISPDGSVLAFLAVGTGGSNHSIYIRPMNSLASNRLESTDGARRFFWSPDSKYLAFFSADGKRLKKISVAGGSAQLVCEIGGGLGDGTWGKNGDILFVDSRNDVVRRVLSSGGDVIEMTRLDTAAGEYQHEWPYFLPDGVHFLYLASVKGTTDARGNNRVVKVGSIGGNPAKLLLNSDSRVEYDQAGFILYVKDSVLMARPFNSKALKLTGEAFPVSKRTRDGPETSFSVSHNGTLVTNESGLHDRWSHRQICWLDRTGKLLGTVGDTAALRGVRLSHDEKRIAYVVEDRDRGTSDVWVRDLTRGVSSRLTSDSTSESCPLWSFDDKRILFARDQINTTDLVSMPSDGTHNEEVVANLKADDAVRIYPQDWSIDERLIPCIRYNLKSLESDIYMFNRFSDSAPRPLLVSSFNEISPALSPDGRYLAYASNETGTQQLYVVSLGKDERTWQISDDGGGAPLWSKTGKELFFTRRGDIFLEVWSVGVELDPTFRAGVASKLFEEDIFTLNARYSPWRYDVTRDGRRFVVDRALPRPDDVSPCFEVTLNWSAEFATK